MGGESKNGGNAGTICDGESRPQQQCRASGVCEKAKSRQFRKTLATMQKGVNIYKKFVLVAAKQLNGQNQ